MRNYLILGSLLAAFLVWGCQGEQTKKSPLGYDYTLHSSEGNPAPKPGEYTYFHAYMRNGDSVVVSSRALGQEPYVQIPVDENEIKNMFPVIDVLRSLGVGDSVTIPIRIDTMPQKPAGFENTDILYYDLVVTEVLTEEAFNAKREAQMAEVMGRSAEKVAVAQALREDYYGGKRAADVKTTASGLKYIMVEEGSGAQAVPQSMVSVHYIGMLNDGNIFDQSFERDETFDFPLGMGQVIKGWDEGIGLLKEGGKALLIIPAELGYGAEGSPPVIPENAELVFYVELEKVSQ